MRDEEGSCGREGEPRRTQGANKAAAWVREENEFYCDTCKVGTLACEFGETSSSSYCSRDLFRRRRAKEAARGAEVNSIRKMASERTWEKWSLVRFLLFHLRGILLISCARAFYVDSSISWAS